jgi:hypothetical protein
MYKDSITNVNPKKDTKDEFYDIRQDRKPGFKWVEGVKEDAVRILRRGSWKLPARNGTVWWQKVWETKG